MDNIIQASADNNTSKPSGQIDSGIPVIEEQLHIGKQVIETGRVHVSKKITEIPFDAEMPVLKEEVIIERKIINQYLDGDAPGMRLDGETTIIPVVREVIVKRLLLVEEIHITKRREEKLVPVHETLHKQEVIITRTSNDNPDSAI